MTIVWVLVLVGAVGIPAVTGLMLYHGGRSVGLPGRSAGIVAVAAGAAWAVWVAGSALIAADGAYRRGPLPGLPWIAVAITGALGAFLLAARVPVVSRILAAPDSPARLAVPQVFRVIGAVFLVALALGRLPALFAVPAGLGDVAVGLAAPFVVRRLRRHRAGAVWFNVLGTVDLAVAISLGYLAGAGPLQPLHTSPSTLALTTLPLALIPTTAVPFAIGLHVLSLQRLAAKRQSAPAGQPAAVAG